MTLPLDGFVPRALAALCNGAYQGLLLALVVAVVLRFWRRANAASRFRLEFVALTVIALLPLVHFLADRPGGPEPGRVALRPVTRGIADPAATREAPRLPAPSLPRVVTPPALEGVEVSPIPEESALQDRGPAVEGDAALTDQVELAVSGLGPEPSAPRRSPASESWLVPPSQDASKRPVSLASTNFPGRWRVPLPRGAGLLLLGAWLAFSAYRLAGLMRQYAALRKLRRLGTPAPEPLAALLDSIGREMGLRRTVVFRLSRHVASPIAMGFRPPAILLPEVLADAAPEDLDRMLRHEAAHLRRRDDWNNLIQQLIVAAFGFHPAVRWLARRLTVDREVACDDHVLAAARSPRDYALFLTDFAARMRGREWLAAPAAWSGNSQLKERIHMLLDPNRNTSVSPARLRTGLFGLAWVLAAGVGLNLGPRLAFGGNDQQAEANAAATTNEGGQTGAADPLTSPDPKSKGADSVLAPALPAVQVVPQPTPVEVVPPVHPLPPVVYAQPGPTPALVAIPASPAAPLILTAPAPVPPWPPHRRDSGRQVAQNTDAAPAKARSSSEDSVDRRLDRLERQIQMLLDRKGEWVPGKSGPPDGPSQLKQATKDLEKERKAMAKAESYLQAEPEAGPGPDGKQLPDAEHINQQVARVLEQVAGQVERATKDAERAVLEAQRSAMLSQQQLRQAQEGKTLSLQQQRRALEAERHSLQQRVQNIEQQLGRLEAQLDRVDEQFERLDEEMDRTSEEHEEAAPDLAPRRDDTVKPPTR